MSTFAVGDEDFLLDGRPVRLLSGALHYFRVHEGHWEHRLGMLRAMGLDGVFAGVLTEEDAVLPEPVAGPAAVEL